MTSLASADTKICVNINILQKSVQRMNAETKKVRKDIPKDVDMKKSVEGKQLVDINTTTMIWKKL